MHLIKKIIKKSGLDFLEEVDFEEKSKGRFFQKEKTEMGNLKFFYVILGPNVESPVHNHKGENMEEAHLLLYGSGKFIIYPEEKELKLKKGKFHPIFSSKDHTPDHKYVAGPEGSVCLALEIH